MEEIDRKGGWTRGRGGGVREVGVVGGGEVKSVVGA